jgi:hypothetical protein
VNIDAGTGAGIAEGTGGGTSTGTNFGWDAPAGTETNDGSGGTALAGCALPGAISVTPGSIGTLE